MPQKQSQYFSIDFEISNIENQNVYWLVRAHCRVPNRSKHLLLLKRGNKQVGCVPPRGRWMEGSTRTCCGILEESRIGQNEENLTSDFMAMIIHYIEGQGQGLNLNDLKDLISQAI